MTIFNAGSKYPTTGGTYGSITLSGNGSYNLSPPTTGTYAGIVIFQSRDNSKALTFSGNASGMTGTIYAPAAQLAESGNAAAQCGRSIVDTLTISGNGVANTVTLSCAHRDGRLHAGPDPGRLRHQQPVAGRHRPDHRHRRCLRRPQHLPGPRRLRLPVRADRLRTDALQLSTGRRRRS